MEMHGGRPSVVVCAASCPSSILFEGATRLSTLHTSFAPEGRRLTRVRGREPWANSFSASRMRPDALSTGRSFKVGVALFAKATTLALMSRAYSYLLTRLTCVSRGAGRACERAAAWALLASLERGSGEAILLNLWDPARARAAIPGGPALLTRHGELFVNASSAADRPSSSCVAYVGLGLGHVHDAPFAFRYHCTTLCLALARTFAAVAALRLFPSTRSARARMCCCLGNQRGRRQGRRQAYAPEKADVRSVSCGASFPW